MAVARLFAPAEESALLLGMARKAAEILGARRDKVPERHRPHYHPEQRYRILRIRSLLGLSQRETAAMFRVSTETIARSETDSNSSEHERARPLVAPIPPVRRFADVVRARYPNHVWMVDLTDVRGLFGIITFKVGAVLDVFSRMPLSIRIVTRQPSSADIVRLVSGTARRHGKTGSLRVGPGTLLHGSASSAEAAAVPGKAALRGGRYEGFDCPDRAALEDIEGCPGPESPAPAGCRRP